MKILKLIGLMLLVANFLMAQDTTVTIEGNGTHSTAGTNNTYIGYDAGMNQTESNNTFIGANAGTGDAAYGVNVGVGTNTLTANNVGVNTAIGNNAGQNVTGGYNAFIGDNAGSNAGDIGYSVAIGRFSLGNGSGTSNVAIGHEAARNTGGSSNVFIGAKAAHQAFVTGSQNMGIGGQVFTSLTSGKQNLAIGYNAGNSTTEGDHNVFMGTNAGGSNTTGYQNAYIGLNSGGASASTHNVAIGSYANGGGNHNVCIGAHAGRNFIEEDDTYKLYIQSQPSNSSEITPLIYGEFANYNNEYKGKVAINCDSIPVDIEGNSYTLAVNGKTITEEVQVMLKGDWQWPDYVFAEDYDLMPLTDLEVEIETLGHLPGVPSAEEVEENGHALGQMDAILLEKIEELTLHLIDMNKEMTDLRERNEALETRLSEVEDK